MDIRAEADIRNEKIGYKLRETRNERVSYIAVIEEKEAGAGTVSVRSGKAGELSIERQVAGVNPGNNVGERSEDDGGGQDAFRLSSMKEVQREIDDLQRDQRAAEITRRCQPEFGNTQPDRIPLKRDKRYKQQRQQVDQLTRAVVMIHRAVHRPDRSANTEQAAQNGEDFVGRDDLRDQDFGDIFVDNHESECQDREQDIFLDCDKEFSWRLIQVFDHFLPYYISFLSFCSLEYHNMDFI